jgi:outer membrane protein assembly factor BamB
MSIVKWPRRWFILPGILIIVLIAVLAGTILIAYLNLFVLPLQPVSHGDFPSKPKWIFTADSRVLSTPVLYDSIMILRTQKAVIGVNAIDGIEIWRTSINPPNGYQSGNTLLAPLIADNLVIVPESSSALTAINVETGKIIWQTRAIEMNELDANVASIEAYASDTDLVFVARDSWKIAAYRLKDGEMVWEKDAPNRVILDIQATDENVYLSAGRILYCYDSRTGDLQWERDYDSPIGRIYVDQDHIYILLPLGKDQLVTLDKNTLEQSWALSSIDLLGDEVRSLSYDSEYLYLGGNRISKVLKLDGSIKWTSDKIGALEHPLIIDSRVVVRNTQHDLYIFDAQNGKQIGQLTLKANTPMKREPERSPAAYENELIIPFGDNRVYAYLIP